MALEINGYNATFQAFADFAAKSIDAGKSKAIARASVDVSTGALAGREVKAATTDSIRGLFKWFRSSDDKAANDATRAIFKDAIVSMFGGESKIPASVKDAMKMADYDCGKPLTARRILAVKAAIDTVKAESMIAKAVKTLQPAKVKQDLDEASIALATEFLVKYGSDLPPKTAQVFANFIVDTTATFGIDWDDEEQIANIAKDMKGWQEFDFGDPRLSKLGAKLAQRQNDYLADTLKSEKKFLPEHPDVNAQLLGDAHRAEFTIGGTKIPSGALIDKFLDTVKDSNARKVISTLLNQFSFTDIENILNKNEAVVGDGNAKKLRTEPIHTIEGGEMFVSRDTSRDGGMGITSDIGERYQLDVSEDGKTATLTMTIDKNINIQGGKYNEYNIGKATISQRVTVDLTKPMPEVVNVTFAQTFTPDEINISTQPGSWAYNHD
jgi:hypothetical protein